jgi:hypothetical protein
MSKVFGSSTSRKQPTHTAGFATMTDTNPFEHDDTKWFLTWKLIGESMGELKFFDTYEEAKQLSDLLHQQYAKESFAYIGIRMCR